MNSVKKVGQRFFLHKLKEHLSNHTYSHNSKKFVPWFSQFSRFFDIACVFRETTRSWNPGTSSIPDGITTDRCFDTVYKILWPLSLAQSAVKVGKSGNLWKSWLKLFWIVNTCDLTKVPALIYNRKTAARPFDTIHDILRALSLVQSLLKGWNASIWRKRELTYMLYHW